MQRELRKKSTLAAGVRAAARRVRGSEVLLGSTVVIVAVIFLAAAGLVYFHPPGHKTISFETTDASSLSVGEDVRVAGVTVGKVSKITIQQATVRVDADIENDTEVGADSRVEVRMLTPVGGYAVTIIPMGSKPLGRAGIPAEHVRVPYSIGDVLQAAPHVTDKVNGADVNANIDQVADAMQHNSTSIQSIIAGMNSIATVMDQQRDQVRRVADLASEYLQTFNGSRDFVFELLRKTEIVVSTYGATYAGFNISYMRLGDILHKIEPFERFYVNHKDQLREAVTKVRQSVADFQKTLGPALDQMKQLQSQFQAWLGPDGLKTLAGGTVMASNICVPVAGRTC